MKRLVVLLLLSLSFLCVSAQDSLPTATAADTISSQAILNAIRDNTAHTVDNTFKPIHDRWPLIISLVALAVAGVTLYFTVKTTKSQKRTERNTRRWSIEQELNYLCSLAADMATRYENLVICENFRVSDMQYPEKFFLAEQKIADNVLHEEGCMEKLKPEYFNKLHLIKKQCMAYNRRIDKHISELDDLFTQPTGYVWEISTLVRIIGEIEELYNILCSCLRGKCAKKVPSFDLQMQRFYPQLDGRKAANSKDTFFDEKLVSLYTYSLDLDENSYMKDEYVRQLVQHDDIAIYNMIKERYNHLSDLLLAYLKHAETTRKWRYFHNRNLVGYNFYSQENGGTLHYNTDDITFFAQTVGERVSIKRDKIGMIEWMANNSNIYNSKLKKNIEEYPIRHILLTFYTQYYYYEALLDVKESIGTMKAKYTDDNEELKEYEEEAYVYDIERVAYVQKHAR